jgi:tetraacyldisaccharide 4'-kinase
VFSHRKDELIQKLFHKSVDFPLFMPIVWLLRVFSWMYLAIINIRLFLYEHGVLNRTKVDATVISVGNITVGGTGKTPFVIFLAELLRDSGLNVATVSRGYKAESSDVIVVSDGTEVFTTSEECGDEPFLIARKTSGIVVLACKDRVKAAKFAVDNFHAQVIILDDAFQHLKIERDWDIVILDATTPFGNGELLPAGILREPKSHLKRADLLILNKSHNRRNAKRLTEQLSEFVPKENIIRSVYEPEIQFADKKILAVSAIGNPNYFHQLIKTQNANLMGKLTFPDHHDYTADDKIRIERIANQVNADLILTTEKDWVKLEKFEDWSCPIMPLPIKIQLIENGKVLALEPIIQEANRRIDR